MIQFVSQFEKCQENSKFKKLNNYLNSLNLNSDIHQMGGNNYFFLDNKHRFIFKY